MRLSVAPRPPLSASHAAAALAAAAATRPPAQATPGTYPSEMTRLRKLKGIYIEVNYLSGWLPTEVGLMSTELTHNLGQSYNYLSGFVPTEAASPPFGTWSFPCTPTITRASSARRRSCSGGAKRSGSALGCCRRSSRRRRPLLPSKTTKRTVYSQRAVPFILGSR